MITSMPVGKFVCRFVVEMCVISSRSRVLQGAVEERGS